MDFSDAINLKTFLTHFSRGSFSFKQQQKTTKYLKDRLFMKGKFFNNWVTSQK